MNENRECLRCGTCCRKGGPALHNRDRSLLDNNIINLAQLITIRQGEPAYNPCTDKVEPAAGEFLKIAGKPGKWECIFFEPEGSVCLIHANRPLECELLECWNSEAVKAVIGRDYLTRFSFIGNEGELGKLIREHERKCSAGEASLLQEKLVGQEAADDASLVQLQQIMREDLALRDQAVRLYNLSLAQEMFCFGRPLFQSILHSRLQVRFEGDTLRLQYAK